MLVNMENLAQGVKWWIHVSGWSMDFHFDGTRAFYERRKHGLTPAWWEETLPELRRWKATRAHEAIDWDGRGRNILNQLNECYKSIRKDDSAPEPDVLHTNWSEIDHLYRLCSSLKVMKTHPYMFASKLCHFIFPKVFVIMDNWGTGVSEYEVYWRGLKSAWEESPHQEDMRTTLRNAISNAKGVRVESNLYPFDTRILELCVIGTKYATYETTEAPVLPIGAS